jgi:prolyl-tRNA editing enzyme YbaK/EbsC (Cys-tRNA(Pro) deacylase)
VLTMRERVITSARQLGLEVEVRTLDTPTRTVAEAAAAVGCDAGQIAKTLVFVADGEPVVVVASGAHRVDTDKLAEAFDCAEIRQASPDEVRAATGYPVGGVSPLCPGLDVVFDEALLRHQRIWAAGGDGNTLFEVDPSELARRIGARPLDVGEDRVEGGAPSATPSA